MNTLSIVKTATDYYIKQTDSEGTTLALFELDRAGYDFDNIDIGYVGQWVNCLDLGQIDHEEDYEGFFRVIGEFVAKIQTYARHERLATVTAVEKLAKEIASHDAK